MSYDLVVFDPRVAPTDYSTFSDWASERVEWVQGVIYDDPSVASGCLRDWYARMIPVFPPMNGPEGDHADSADGDVSILGDYSITSDLIYASFAWSQTGNAYKASFEAAAECKVGLFEVSDSSGRVWLPSSGSLVQVYPRKSQGIGDAIRRVFSRKQ